MEIKLNKASVSYYSKVLDIEFSKEETAENIVPDTLPDVAEIVDADGMAILRGKDISEGRISVNGMVFGYILYRAEDGQLRRMPVQLPFSAYWDNTSITQSCRSLVKLSVSSFEGRIINSRKLLLRADVALSASIYHAENCEYTEGAECSQLECLNESISFNHVCAVGERTFTIAEELQLPPSKPQLLDVLKYRAKLVCNEVKAVGSRIVVKGNAQLYLLYKGDMQEELCGAEFTIPFSQIYDTDCKDDIIASNAVLMMTGVYIDTNEGTGEPTSRIRVEIGAVAQFCAWSKGNICCLSDVYSTRNEISMNLASVKIKESNIGDVADEAISLLLSTERQPKSIIDCYAYLGKQRIENGLCIWPISARALYESDEGKISTSAGKCELKCDAAARINAEIGEVAAKAVSGGIELRIPVSYLVIYEDEIGFATPEEIIVNDECEKNITGQPSVIVLKADGNTSLWSMAKQFNTTIGAINEANPGIGEGTPEKGTLLLIAKKR